MFIRLLTISLLTGPVAFATQIHIPKTNKKFIYLTIEKADPSSDVISVNGNRVYDLEAANGITQTLVCRFQDDPKDIPKSFIEYKNFANLIVGRFYFSHHKECDKFVKHTDKIFEFVNDEYPIEMVLDVQKRYIAKVFFPNLDPFIDHMPQKDLKDENSLSDANKHLY